MKKVIPVVLAMALGSPAFAQDVGQAPSEDMPQFDTVLPADPAPTSPPDTGRSIANDEDWLEDPQPSPGPASPADPDATVQPDDSADPIAPPEPQQPIPPEQPDLLGPESPPEPPLEVEEGGPDF